MKKYITNCGKINISNRISELRLMLHKAYEQQGISKEVIKTSQELDICIYKVQKELVAKIVKKEKKPK